jgi:hypothetical protein
MQSRIDAAFIACGELRKCRDQVLIVQAPVGASSLGQSERQPHQQMLFLVHKLIRDFDPQKQSRGIDLVGRARFLVFARLL